MSKEQEHGNQEKEDLQLEDKFGFLKVHENFIITV